ncbi:MAG TPA: hypothetical protein VJP86_02960 [Vicinamibacterales bacterium]|jgi:hypothetical protein|nr:hypothetical protein [Vicinamibacterales bacterium]
MNRGTVATALTLGILAGSASTLLADVRADQKNLVKFEGALGRIVNMFGGKAAKDGVKSTDAVKGDRKISLSDTSGQIIDLAEEKIYDLDVKKKTYRVTTFEEIRRRMAEAQRKAEEDAKKQTAPADRPQDTSGKELEIDFDVKDTGLRKAINGFDTRQVVMTLAMREKGKTIDQSGGLVVTADTWLTPTIASMKELAEFNARYARQLAGPMIAGASPEEVASAMAMYPGMKDAMARLRTEGAKLDGTPILTTVIVEAVKSAEQLAEEQKTQQQQSQPSASGGLGGLAGGLMKKAVTKSEPPKPRVTVMTTTNEVLKVTTDVAAADVAVPAGFKEAR